jgi:hypothetical protein
MNDRLPSIERIKEIAHMNRMLRRKENEKVYFVEAIGLNLIKIGHTQFLKSRIKALETQCPVPVILIGTILGNRAVEVSLHWEFRHIRSHGEWFEKTDNLMKRITELTKF